MDHHTFPERQRLATLTAEKLRDTRALDYMRWLSALHESDGAELVAVKISRGAGRDRCRSTCSKKARRPRAARLMPIGAAPLSATLASAFLELARPAPLLGKIGGLRRVPARVSIAVQTGGASANWVAQSTPTPVSALSFATTALVPRKLAAIVAVSAELMRHEVPGTAQRLSADLIGAQAAFLDTQFTDPTVAAVTDVSPASITNAATPMVRLAAARPTR